MRGAVPGEFSFYGRQKEQQPPLLTGIEPGRVIDDFRLIAPIGQGGMGQVWEAEQISLNRRVALKLVRPDRVPFSVWLPGYDFPEDWSGVVDVRIDCLVHHFPSVQLPLDAIRRQRDEWLASRDAWVASREAK